MRIAAFDGQRVEEIGALIVSIQRQEFDIPITYEQQPDLQDIAGFYQKGDGQFWMALDGDQVVGTIALLDIGSGQGALRKMFVAGSHRGASHGVAAALLKTLLDHAREKRMQSIYLGTTAQFLAAHRFYEKHGFELIDPEQLPPTFPRMAVDSRFYHLQLETGVSGHSGPATANRSTSRSRGSAE